MRLSNQFFAATENNGIRSRFEMRLTANSSARRRARSASRATVLLEVLADSRITCPWNRNL